MESIMLKDQLRLSKPLVIVGAVSLMMLLTGCASKPSTTAHGELGTALNDYHQQRYAGAKSRAEIVAQNATGREREEAIYLAGISAFQLGDIPAAEKHLREASQASDPEIGGRSKAMLAIVRMRQGRYREAGDLYSGAAKQLQGNDAAEAGRLAAIAYGESGDTAKSQQWAQASAGSTGTSSLSADPTSPIRLASRLNAVAPNSYSLQVGVFREKDRAEKAAKAAKPLAERSAMGPVRVVPSVAVGGDKVYIVQFGEFKTKEAADRARQRTHGLDCIVAPAAIASAQ
jgi:tetratricopeptide (TPR) repeat protein